MPGVKPKVSVKAGTHRVHLIQNLVCTCTFRCVFRSDDDYAIGGNLHARR